MVSHPLQRATPFAFAAAGVSLALWSAGHPWNRLAGAAVGHSLGWRVAHTGHFLGGLLLLFALLGLYAHRRHVFEPALGLAALVVAFTGSALFMAGGVFTAFIWPVLAVHAPHVLAADGPFFAAPDRLLVVTTVTFAAGLVLLGAALRRARLIHRTTAALLTVGPLLLLAAPPPIGRAPWLLFALSGVITGSGLVAVGRAVRNSG